MKKFFKIISITLFLIIGLIASIPFLFKGKILEIVQQQINENVNAKIAFSDFNLSIFKSFPSLTVTLDELTVIGTDKFENDTLAAIKQLYADLDIMSVINGDQISVKAIVIENPIINGRVLADSSANWDIAKATEEKEEETDTAQSTSEFKLGLENFEIQNAYISFDDATIATDANIQNLNFKLKGDMTANKTALQMDLSIDSISASSEGIEYLNKALFKFKAAIDADMKNMKYTFKENQLYLNKLMLAFDGWVQMYEENDNIDINMTLMSNKATFKDVLSLVPAFFMKGYEGLQTNGNFSFESAIKGRLNTETESYPAFDFSLIVDNAMFKYPDLPGKADNIALNLNVTKLDGGLDATEVNLSKFHIEFENNPFDMTFLLKKPISDPEIRCSFMGKIDLDKMKNILPLEDTKLSGLITSNIEMAGRLSMIEEERYEEFKALGQLKIENMLYEATGLPSVTIESTEMEFSPQYVELSSFDTKVGNSDFHLIGKMENFIPYALADGTLKGEFTYWSDLLDSNEFIEDETADETEETIAEDSVYEAAVIPKNIDFTLETQISKILYDKMEINHTKGAIYIKDGKADLSGLEMDLLGGHMKMDGYYSTLNPQEPKVDLNMDITNFSIKETYNSLSSVQEMAPFLENCAGKFDMTFSYNSIIDNEYAPVLNTVNGSGIAHSKEMQMSGSKLQVFLVEKLKQSDYEVITAKDQTIRFNIVDGEIKLDTMYSQFSGNLAETYGISKLDQSIDYTVALKIPRTNLGGAANQLLSEASNLLADKGVGATEVGDIILADVLIGGTILDPTYKFKIRGTEDSNVKDAVKDKIKDEFNKKKAELEAKAKAEAAKRKAEAEAKAKAEADKLKKEADKKKAEAEAKAKAEAEKKKNELKNKASDKLKKMW